MGVAVSNVCELGVQILRKFVEWGGEGAERGKEGVRGNVRSYSSTAFTRSLLATEKILSWPNRLGNGHELVFTHRE